MLRYTKRPEFATALRRVTAHDREPIKALTPEIKKPRVASMADDADEAATPLRTEETDEATTPLRENTEADEQRVPLDTSLTSPSLALSVTSEDNEATERLWRTWPGRNRFFMDGSVMLGADVFQLHISSYDDPPTMRAILLALRGTITQYNSIRQDCRIYTWLHLPHDTVAGRAARPRHFTEAELGEQIRGYGGRAVRAPTPGGLAPLPRRRDGPAVLFSRERRRNGLGDSPVVRDVLPAAAAAVQTLCGVRQLRLSL